MSAKTRAALVGCGGISKAWLASIQAMDSVEMVALVDIAVANAQAEAQEFALESAVVSDDLEKALSDTQPEVLFNCTIPEAHAPVTLTALAHGCHVLTEKPLADTMDNAHRMIAAAEAADRILAVVQNRRYDANIRRLRGLVETGVVGPLTTAHCDFLVGAHFGGFRDHMAHVLLLDMAIHTFDAARLITGADPITVYCHEWNPAGSWYDRDASAVAIFEMSDGLVYTYRGSWCAEGLNTSWECDWRLIGQQGSIRWDGGTQIVGERVAATGGFRSALEPIQVPAAHPGAQVGGHGGVIREFLRCVRSGETPETAATDNVKSLAMVFGAIESAESKRLVSIRY